MSASAGTSTTRRWPGYLLRFGVVIALLAVVAHARHQSIGQLVSGAVQAANGALDPDGGVLADMRAGMSEPDITLSSTSGRLPARITVNGTGYRPHEKVEVRAHVAVLATAVADAHGRFNTTIAVPADEFCPHRQCRITAEGKQSIRWTTAPYDVTGRRREHR